jgi:hypothetical protein
MKALSATILINFNLQPGIWRTIQSHKGGLKMRRIKIIVIAMIAMLVGCASTPGRTTSAPQSQSMRPMFEQMPGNFSNPPGAPDAAPTSAAEANQ